MGMLDGKVAVITGAGSGMAKARPRCSSARGRRWWPPTSAIVNWSSIGGLNASVATSVYGAAKAGVISLTKTAALEYGPKRIRVNAICPGYIKTEIMGATLDQYPGAADKTPLRRLGLAHEVAEVAAFLVSDRASFVTGAIIPVDGGRCVQIV